MDKKKVLDRIVLFLVVIGIMAGTVLSVYTFKIWYNDGSFVFEHMLSFFGSVALVLACFIVSFILIVRIIGGSSNGKNR